ncbi:hypothetical protein HV824_36085, partial [Myxococcus sp. AM009]|uniref:hypothetical protein n=1 Tax=Myxococcus sp. AM009 TaxID=2745137 RepID=UPI0018062D27
STLVLARFLWLVPRPEEGRHAHGGPGLWGPWAALTVLAFAAVWGLAPDTAVAKVLSGSGAWAALWPVLAGSAVAGALWRWRPRDGWWLPEVPTGDVALVLLRAGAWLRDVGRRRSLARPRVQGRVRFAKTRSLARGPWAEAVEARLGAWSTLGLALLVLVGLYVV